MELLYIAHQPDKVIKKDRKESPLPHHIPKWHKLKTYNTTQDNMREQGPGWLGG